MSREAREQLLDQIGEVEEKFILEYLEEAPVAAVMAEKRGANRRGRLRGRFAFGLAAVMVMLFGTVCLAAAPAIGHFLDDLRKENQIIIRNYDEIEKEYGIFVGHRQECGGVTGTLNSAALEDHYLLLSYTFDWSSLEGAEDGSFHTWFLPWFFYITEGDTVICRSEYTRGLHTQDYPGGGEKEAAEATYIYCIDLGNVDGTSLVGKELTVRLLYAEEGEGFVSSFTPESCFVGRSWSIDNTCEFQGHRITLNKVRESALYMTLFIECDDIGHPGDELTFLLSDELDNAYAAYSYGDVDKDGYWFTKPEAVGRQLTLKVIRRDGQKTPEGVTIDDSYEVLYEIPVRLKHPD